MTAVQPRLIRADTLDLQSPASPSAKDHTRSPTFAPYTHGLAGPHHREALRNAEESAYNDRKSSPRISMEDASVNGANHTHQYDSTDDDGDDEQHDDPDDPAHHDGDEYDEANDENDDDLEDDLLDKISSSPSIEDGKYSHFLWPPRVDSIGRGASPASSPVPTRGSSPVVVTTPPSDILSARSHENHSVSHHLSSPIHKKSGNESLCVVGVGNRSNEEIRANVLPRESLFASTVHLPSGKTKVEEFSHLLLPTDDPLLDDGFEDEIDEITDQDWVDEGEPWYEEGSSSDDDYDDFQFSDNPRFIDSGWGGECLRDVEDIDFEFVYALHTFVATVEGQANATKGDTMVLLDDTNSYWWLVRVVKDGSIGYLPAEHIETPTERLARLNKHRNIDLSASMLGDNPEKSKNPLKKAMRRRNAKTVAFTAPTYYEPSEYEYSSEEDEEEEGMEGVVHSQHQNVQQSEAATVQENQQSVDPQDSIVIVNGIKQITSEEPVSVESPTSPVHTEAANAISSQAQPDEVLQRSRNGVVRNTDSFFKDDTAETKKISLTPRLLRNDNDTSNPSNEDLRSKSSADTFDKVLGEEKSKEKEKKKEKKGMLSGLFKRKDKSSKNAKSDAEDERIDDTSRPTQTKDALETVSAPQSPEKKPGKLQKHQPAVHISPKNSPTEIRQAPLRTTLSPVHSPNPSDSVAPAAEHVAEHGETLTTNGKAQVEQASNQPPSPVEKRSIFAPITTVLKTTPSSSSDHEHTVKPVYSKRAKERFAIDGSDSEDNETPTTSQTPQDNRPVSPIRTSQLPDSRPDSAMEVSPVDQSDHGFNDSEPQSASHTPTHMTSDPHAHGPLSDTASTSKPSPSLATHTPSTSRSTPTWSDASLRSYMENDQDIRDLLIIVHDKSSVTPVGPDHPLMGGLFMTERTRLAEMQTQLDSMLTTWISKKNPALLSR